MSNIVSNKKLPDWLAWAVSAAVTLIAVVVWGGSFKWQLGSITSYQFFPLLGLVAFSIMWTHYIVGFIYTIAHQAQDSLKAWYRYSGYVVLLAILFHPGILIYQRYKDGYGLPPKSYANYFGPNLKWVIMLGSVSLLVFLSFELHRFFGKKKWWSYIANASDFAMIAIFYHGLRLGDQLQAGWFRYVWFIYGISLIAVLGYKYVTLIQKRISQPAHA